MSLEFCFAEHFIPRGVTWFPLTVRSCVCWMNELAKIDQRLALYFLPIALLHVARRISRNGCNKELLDTLAIIPGSNVNTCFSDLSQRETELNTSELVELLQKSAVEHLTTYRQNVARDLSHLATIVTTDFEALYAYKRGDYQRCLQLSTENVQTLLSGVCMGYIVNVVLVTIFRDFIQLLDDDIVSLITLAILNLEVRRDNYCFFISQVTLSLYLMTQCQLNLRHSVKSLTKTLVYIKIAQIYITHPPETLDRLTLRLIERKVRRTISH